VRTLDELPKSRALFNNAKVFGQVAQDAANSLRRRTAERNNKKGHAAPVLQPNDLVWFFCGTTETPLRRAKHSSHYRLGMVTDAIGARGLLFQVRDCETDRMFRRHRSNLKKCYGRPPDHQPCVLGDRFWNCSDDIAPYRPKDVAAGEKARPFARNELIITKDSEEAKTWFVARVARDIESMCRVRVWWMATFAEEGDTALEGAQKALFRHCWVHQLASF